MSETKTETNWGTRQIYLMEMMSQTLGVNTMLYLPSTSATWGAAGHAIVLFVIYISVGIPLLYMEAVVGQFTGRDCLEVWNARAWLSHIGYFHIFWQVLYLIYLHTLNSFIMHYLLISFETPMPYYACGHWSMPDCDILNHNYSVNQDCLKLRQPLPYCKNLCNSFPEVQYWRFFVLGLNKDGYSITWRVGLASTILSVITFFSCLRGRQSMKWILIFVTIFPMAARVVFMIGSLLQKGLVVKFEEAVDADFSLFVEKFSLTNSISEVMYSLKVGTGLTFGCSSRTSFRAPCYSNTVLVVVVSALVLVLGVCSTAMMICPYAFKFDVKPTTVMAYPLANIFEKIPRFIHVYEATSFWLIICFAFIGVSALGLSINIVLSLTAIVAKRHLKLSKYPGLISFLFIFSVYILTTPLLGSSVYFLVDLKRHGNMIMLFLAMIENIVFVQWYGLERFSEDVHFMQGVPPRSSIKFSWFILIVVLVYVFFSQFIIMFNERNTSVSSQVGCWMIIVIVGLGLIVTVVKLIIGAYKKKIRDLVRLDSTWGPKTEILKRSRAMFTAQAMTKEYMYRQYHLQAGILMRQKRSNVRICQRPGNKRIP